MSSPATATRAADSDRHRRRSRGRRPLPRLAAALGTAPHHPAARAADFDSSTRWTGRSVGGCRYHVSHPGGRAFETFPVNAYEAEGRRLARFEDNGHTAGTMRPGPVDRNPDYPCTLDLRRHV